jgi:hypothetical protein
VRRGADDQQLKSFLAWNALLQCDGVAGMIGNGTTWNSIWARGIHILDPTCCVDDSIPPNSKKMETEYDDGLVYHELFPDDKEFFAVSLPASLFGQLAQRQRDLVEKYLWCPESNLYYDYDCCLSIRSVYKSCTAIWPLWAHIPSPERAKELVRSCMKYFCVTGGLVAGTEESRGSISLTRPSRQWDYPFGWVCDDFFPFFNSRNLLHA